MGGSLADFLIASNSSEIPCGGGLDEVSKYPTALIFFAIRSPSSLLMCFVCASTSFKSYFVPTRKIWEIIAKSKSVYGCLPLLHLNKPKWLKVAKAGHKLEGHSYYPERLRGMVAEWHDG